MNRVLMTLIAGAFAVSLGACNQAQDSAEVQDDSAAAQPQAQEDMTQAPADMNQGATGGESPLAQAESEHQSAMERCDALPSTEQQTCKDDAHATYEAAKAAAEMPGPS